MIVLIAGVLVLGLSAIVWMIDITERELERMRRERDD